MNICVFCGSGTGNQSVYAQAARELGATLAKKNHCLVYGGGNVGLMGILADSILAHGGEVIGVIPQFLVNREVGHHGVTRLEIVQSMHERKKRMADLANAFIAMPGGWGTLDELAEILTWRQLNIISQPVGLLNSNNFFDHLMAQMNLMVQEGFLHKENLQKLIVHSEPSILIDSIIPQQGL
jgi:uncharacterized protein (TIGR00730 family)